MTAQPSPGSCDAAAGEQRYTVARVRLQPAGAEVMFFESARIYQVPRAMPVFDDAVALLHEAERTGTGMCVRADDDGVITVVRRAG